MPPQKMLNGQKWGVIMTFFRKMIGIIKCHTTMKWHRYFYALYNLKQITFECKGWHLLFSQNKWREMCSFKFLFVPFQKESQWKYHIACHASFCSNLLWIFVIVCIISLCMCVQLYTFYWTWWHYFISCRNFFTFQLIMVHFIYIFLCFRMYESLDKEKGCGPLCPT